SARRCTSATTSLPTSTAGCSPSATTSPSAPAPSRTRPTSRSFRPPRASAPRTRLRADVRRGHRGGLRQRGARGLRGDVRRRLRAEDDLRQLPLQARRAGQPARRHQARRQHHRQPRQGHRTAPGDGEGHLVSRRPRRHCRRNGVAADRPVY
ncbi:geranylgeranyl hydrogenase1, partial [Zea mays]